MNGMPRAAWSNLLTSAPLVVSGINQDGSAATPLTSANQANGAAGVGLAGAGILGFDGALYRRLGAALAGDGAADVFNLQTASKGLSYNGATWDRNRNNYGLTMLASAARSTTTDTPVFSSFNAKGFWAVLEVTANPGGGETLALQMLADYPVIATSLLFLSTAPIVAGAKNYAIIQVGDAAQSNPISTVPEYAKTVIQMPPRFFFRIEHSGAGVWTYQVVGAYCV